MRRQMSGAIHLLGVGALLVSSLPRPVAASTNVAMACERAAAMASRETGVPISVLRAIALVETGRKTEGDFLPWPWTVNMEGAGKWFDTGDDAMAYVETAIQRGARSFDLGCFQINFRWHGEAFSSVREMFDPMANAIYAARFLSALHAELGDWNQAAGAFHSRTPEFASKYRKRFEEIRARVANETPQPTEALLIADPVPQQSEPPRVNQFPLLIAGAGGSGGSLFPLEAGRGRHPFLGAAANPLTEN